MLSPVLAREAEMIVAEVMTHQIVTVMPGHSVRHAAQIMLDHHVSGLPVVEGDGRLVGILTEGDLLRRTEFGSDAADASGWARANWTDGNARDFVRSHSWRVEDVMSRPVLTATEDMPLSQAAILMGTRGIKRLPVVRDGQVVGVVSRADLLQIIANASPEPIAVGDDAMEVSCRARLREVAPMFAACPEVSVADGVVHLWGRVRSEAERDVARVAVEGVPRVRGIEDHLVIQLPSAAPAMR
jgi:CBS domain-containing protein